MRKIYSSIKTLALVGVMALTGSNAFGQIKVNYDALPDYDNVPPVKAELGIPGANAKNSITPGGVAKARGVIVDGEGLPTHWNNAMHKHFPPYFYQAGPSCMCSSFVGYIFTHELNAFRDLEGAKPENQMAVFFSWLQTFQNTGKEDFELYNGCPNSVDYEGRTNSDVIGYYDWRANNAGWMQGYDKWYRAMWNRAEGHYTFPYTVAKEDGRNACKHWVYNHNGDMDFKSGGLCYVTLASSGMSSYRIADTPANQEAGAVDKYYIGKWGKEIDHAMTIIGWDDRLEFDFNDNGIYGEESADEKGAWIVANSWGQGWLNGGWVYVPYRYAGPIGSVTGNYFWQPYVTYIRKNYVPKRTMKLMMDYSHRSELFLSVGVSADTTAKSPASSTPMSAFKNAGDGTDYGENPKQYPEVPMLGMYTDGLHHEPMEWGYDMTDLSSSFDPSQPLKYFFTVRTTAGIGKGHIYKASIIDYTYETENGVEIPFNIDTIEISKDNGYTYTISVVVPGEAINPPVNASLAGNTLKWEKPAATSMVLKKYYVYKGTQLADSILPNKLTYAVDDPAATYSISAVYGYKNSTVESVKSNMAYASVPMPEGDNMVVNVNNGSLYVPSVLPDRLNEGTIEFWVNPNEVGKTNHHFSFTGDENFFFEISASGQAVAGWSEDDKVATAAKSIKANTWTHVAIVVQQSTMTLYINGMKKGSVTAITHGGIPALHDMYIGSEGEYANAKFDELRIWRKARTQAELYSSKDLAISNPASQIDLIAYLPMNTIEQDGVEKYREYVCGNHAYLVSGNAEAMADASVLKPSTFKMVPTITFADSIYVNEPHKLVGTASVAATAWKWEIPGVRPSTYDIQSPYVTFPKTGTYNVALTVTMANGETTTIEKEVEVIGGTLPQPDFDMSAVRIPTAKSVSFTNRTVGGNCSYVWDVEGIGQINVTNASVAFETPGIYNVTLIATNSAGSASVTKQVEVYMAHPFSQFNVAPNNIYVGETTYLEDKSTGKPDSWIWTLSNGKRYLQVDGQYSSLVPPAPGFYDVSLQTNNAEGGNITTKKRALCVSNADAQNGLNFIGNDEQIQLDRPFKENQSAFTIEWWMNPAVYAGAGGFTFGDLTTDCTDKGVFSLMYKTRRYTINLPTINEWHHYAITFNSGNILIFKDGEQVGSLNAVSEYTTPSWPDKFTFGRSDSPFHGYIDEMRIWSTQLSKIQLQAFCNKPIENPSKLTSLCVYYDFNQNGGDVIDRTGHGYDAKRINFGPDGDAWIISPGVFTLDFDANLVKTDVSSKYLTNYKAPFKSTGVKLNPNRSNALELETETAASGWIFKSPRQTTDQITTAPFVDNNYQQQLNASTYYSFGQMVNQRLWQTVTLPQGHYRLSISTGSFDPNNSRLVVCVGDSIVGNENLDNALTYTLLNNAKQVEFDVVEENTPISLGIIYNITSTSSMIIHDFKLEQITSTSQVADGLNDAYEAVSQGKLGMFSGETGAIRIVTNDITSVKIYNATGQCVFNDYVSGNKRLPFQPGIYIVNGEKVQVK